VLLLKLLRNAFFSLPHTFFRSLLVGRLFFIETSLCNGLARPFFWLSTPYHILLEVISLRIPWAIEAGSERS
jgi:hypothetical protein